MRDVRLQVFTAPISYAGDDRVDMRVGTVDPIGKLFEPPAELKGCGLRTFSETVWEGLCERYDVRLRASYRVRRPDWLGLRHHLSITLVCDCPTPEGCYRTRAARALVLALPGLSVLRGERRTQRELQGGAR